MYQRGRRGARSHRLAFDARTDTLYVASTADNAIYAVESASHRATAANKGSRYSPMRICADPCAALRANDTC